MGKSSELKNLFNKYTLNSPTSLCFRVYPQQYPCPSAVFRWFSAMCLRVPQACSPLTACQPSRAFTALTYFNGNELPDDQQLRRHSKLLLNLH